MPARLLHRLPTHHLRADRRGRARTKAGGVVAVIGMTVLIGVFAQVLSAKLLATRYSASMADSSSCSSKSSALAWQRQRCANSVWDGPATSSGLPDMEATSQVRIPEGNFPG